MKRLMLLLFVGLVACKKAPAPAAPAPLSDEGVRLDALVKKTLEGRPVPGVSVAVWHHGELVLARGYGQADVAATTPVAPETIFRIGSITKSFTAATILKLAAAGKLSVDAPITTYLPDYDTKGKTITVRHLLTHTSGIKGYTEIDAFGKRMAEHFPRSELVAMFAAEPLQFEPGEKWAYSNSGYYLLGLIIEKVSGQPYAEAVRTLVIEPAGLTHTAYCPPEMTGTTHARGYHFVERTVMPSEPLDMEHPYAAGSLCSTASDLTRWMAALAADRAAFAQMTEPAKLTGGGTAGYGFGLGVGELEGHRLIGHGGGINGFTSQLDYYPDDELTIAVLANFEGSAPGDVSEALARLVLDVPLPVFADLPISAAEAAQFLGTYHLVEAGVKIVTRYQNGKVETANLDDKGEPGDWIAMSWQGGLVFEVPQVKAQLAFTVEHGKATKVRVKQGGMEVDFVRISD